MNDDELKQQILDAATYAEVAMEKPADYKWPKGEMVCLPPYYSLRVYITLASPANIRSLIEGYEAQLKTVLDREAATQKRHDDKVDALEAKLAQARKEALGQAAIIAATGVNVAERIRTLITKEPA